MNFANSLKAILIDRNLKQVDLCKRTNISTSLMSDYIKGKKEPGLAYLSTMANALNLSIDELVFYADNTASSNHDPSVNELQDRFSYLISLVPDDMRQHLLDLIEATLKSRGLLQ